MPTRLALAGLLLAACGASAAEVHPDTAQVAAIRALASDEMECAAEHVHIHRIGEGDTARGDQVGLYWVSGCNRMAEYFCGDEGCRRHHSLHLCSTPPPAEPPHRDCELAEVRRAVPDGATVFDFEDVCGFEEHPH